MPGYLITPIAEASSIPVVPSGNITASNLQDALQQLDTNKAETTAVSASVSSLNENISSVEGVALLGL
jgi:hypothetical protein